MALTPQFYAPLEAVVRSDFELVISSSLPNASVVILELMGRYVIGPGQLGTIVTAVYRKGIKSEYKAGNGKKVAERVLDFDLVSKVKSYSYRLAETHNRVVAAGKGSTIRMEYTKEVFEARQKDTKTKMENSKWCF